MSVYFFTQNTRVFSEERTYFKFNKKITEKLSKFVDLKCNESEVYSEPFQIC